MREPRLIQDYLRDILDAMDKAEDFVFELDLRAFSIDDKTAFAVIRSLEIIGEVAKKDSARSATPFPKYSLEESDRDAGQIDSRLCRGES